MSSAMETPPAVTVRVPAKVNLELLVGPAREDGYHALSTAFQAVSIHDDVTVDADDDWGVTVSGRDAAAVPTDETNIALRAARLLAAHAGLDEPVHVSISKGIPVAGGMAGGSADAAATLIACDHLWGLGTPREELLELAAELGSDVPFLLHGGTAIGSGRGELLAPVLARGRFHWVFVPAKGEGLSTPAVYGEFDRLHAEAGTTPADPEPSPAMMSALRSGDATALAGALTNDLQPAALALRPDLATVLEAGLGFGALGGLVSGSGPTVAFLTAGAESAIDLAVALTASGVAHDVLRATGPVHGAHLLTAPRIS
ncbi:4-(cytidine 5'-diphospho)-2-C-methyl-D-erythritol kinase [Janibacter sp. G1551]|uniref:4-(cytidine 5'-diphospho)-2-C-methyl-D-erythritol kinase n=1 Tax=Janibacter sp. G1551 TaxID=3420440 RepID=UPI003D04262E